MKEKLDLELSKLTEKTLRMLSLTREMVEGSSVALQEHNTKKAQAVMQMDTSVDELELEIETDTITLLARQQLVASDLRFAFTLLKILTDLERAGDYAAHVAEDVLLLAKESPLKAYIALPDMARRLAAMLDLLSKALAERDVEAATKALKADDEVDGIYEQVSRELLTYIMEDPRTISKGLTLLRVARSYERLGDHLENIAERILYWQTGQTIRSDETVR